MGWTEGISRPVALQLARGGDWVLVVGRSAELRRGFWLSCAGLPGADVMGRADQRPVSRGRV